MCRLACFMLSHRLPMLLFFFFNLSLYLLFCLGDFHLPDDLIFLLHYVIYYLLPLAWLSSRQFYNFFFLEVATHFHSMWDLSFLARD